MIYLVSIMIANEIGFNMPTAAAITLNYGCNLGTVEDMAEEIWAAWFSMGVEDYESEFGKYLHECAKVHQGFFARIPNELILEKMCLETVMEHFGIIAQDGERRNTIWQDWLSNTRDEVDGSDDELLEWASKYALAYPHLFVGCTDDPDVCRKALRMVADTLLATVLLYLDQSLEMAN
ncbi:MAG TPA: hypothetical protein VHL98_22270 [Microvirga sp.]|nr:hypothetical protein [Microvirga sp.]